MRGFLLGGAALIASMPAAAQDWRALGFNENSSDGSTVVYFDAAATRQPAAGTRDITIANVFEKVQRFSDGDEYWMIETSYRIDCATMMGNSTRTAAIGIKGPVLTSNNPGKPVAMAATPYRRAASVACSGEAAPGARAEGSPIEDAPLRFRHRALVQSSIAGTGWVRVSYGGPAGKQLAIFADRSSITTDARGRRMLATMVIEEEPSAARDPKRFHYATLVDCAANTRTNVYARVFAPSGDYLGTVFPAATPSVMTPGKLVGGLAAVCSGNWTGKRAYPMAPQAVIATAFAP